MTKRISNCIIFLVCLTSYTQEYYFVNAKIGLNVRSEPHLSSKKTATLPFGIMVEKISDTANELIVEDNGKQIRGNWVKIRYTNYPYLVSEETTSFERKGYVFDGYLKKMKNENSITITEINTATFNELLQGVPKQVNNLKKISNFDSIKKHLKDKVTWVKVADEPNDISNNKIKSITKPNGQKLIINQESNDYGFLEESSAYYPEYDILVLEGGHSSDVSFSLKTGETTATAGNPEYIIASPENTYRLNGTFGGQECISYFFQKKVKGLFSYFTEVKFDGDLCTFKAFYCINETKFIYSKMNYSNNAKNGEVNYFIGQIKDKT